MPNAEIENILTILREEYGPASVIFSPDSTGGGNVIIENVDIGSRYQPSATWIGAYLNNALPYADIYPLFIGGNVIKLNGAAHHSPITAGPSFEGRSALQISKRTNNLLATSEAAAMKFAKVLHYVKEVAP